MMDPEKYSSLDATRANAGLKELADEEVKVLAGNFFYTDSKPEELWDVILDRLEAAKSALESLEAYIGQNKKSVATREQAGNLSKKPENELQGVGSEFVDPEFLKSMADLKGDGLAYGRQLQYALYGLANHSEQNAGVGSLTYLRDQKLWRLHYIPRQGEETDSVLNRVDINAEQITALKQLLTNLLQIKSEVEAKRTTHDLSLDKAKYLSSQTAMLAGLLDKLGFIIDVEYPDRNLAQRLKHSGDLLEKIFEKARSPNLIE